MHLVALAPAMPALLPSVLPYPYLRTARTYTHHMLLLFYLAADHAYSARCGLFSARSGLVVKDTASSPRMRVFPGIKCVKQQILALNFPLWCSSNADNVSCEGFW